jgi:hypothetical protein
VNVGDGRSRIREGGLCNGDGQFGGFVGTRWQTKYVNATGECWYALGDDVRSDIAILGVR